MNKEPLPKFLILSLAIILAGFASAINVLGDTASTTADIDNIDPVFTVNASDNGSDGTTPTDVGSDVTFTATATDANNDNYYLAICTTNAITPGNSAAPTCDGGAWAISTSTASGAQSSVTYTALVGDSESNDWYSFVCDHNAAGLCSRNGITDSPFKVNHAGTFGSIVFIDGADGTYDTYPDSNGVTLTTIETGFDAYSDAVNFTFVETEGIDCTAETASSLSALITGSGSFVLNCDLDDSTQGAGANPVTGTLFAAAITDGTGTIADDSVTAAAAGTGASAITAGNSSVRSIFDLEPGDILEFGFGFRGVTDSDTDTAQDTAILHVCSGESDTGGVTTTFDYSANTCTSGTKLCSSASSNPVTDYISCADTTDSMVVPVAHGSYDVKIFVEDGHNFAATGTVTQSYSISDVAPVITSYTTTDSVDGTISAGGSDDLTRLVTFTDDNGDNDPTLVDMTIFDADDSETDACTADEQNCYRFDNEDLTGAANCAVSNRSTAGSGKTAQGTDTSLSLSCDFTVYFNANASSNWEVSATVTDGLGDVNFADSSVNTVVAALSGISVSEASIPYGTVGLGGTSTSGDVATMQNKGNQVIDAQISGTNMTSGGDSIATAQQKWDYQTQDFDWDASGTAFAMLTTPSGTTAVGGCANASLVVRAVAATGTEDETVFWKIRIPAAQEAGVYSGTNTFTSAADGTCTDNSF